MDRVERHPARVDPADDAWLAGSLLEAGVEVHVMDARAVESVAPYDAVVVGSAIHMGRWMGPARDVVNTFAEALRARPVWLFSSGPLGDIVDPADAAEGVKLAELVGARDHRVFAGSAEKRDHGVLERGILSMVKAPYGDHRDWVAIRDWATSIAKELTAVPA